MSNVKFCKVLNVCITAFVFDNVLETIIAPKGINRENAANLQTEYIMGEEGGNIWQYRRVGFTPFEEKQISCTLQHFTPQTGVIFATNLLLPFWA